MGRFSRFLRNARDVLSCWRKTTAEETSHNIAHSTSVDSPDSPVDSGDDADRDGACGDGDDTASVGDEESTGDDDDTSTEDSESKSDDTVSVATTTGGHSFVPYWQGQVGVVRGCLTQFTIKSRYQGNQCTSMSYTALCWAFVIPIDTWTSAIIDDILRAGNNMHNEFRDTLLLSTEADGRISIDDVPLAFSVDVCGVPCISNRGEVTYTFSSLSPEIADFAKEAGLLSIQDFIESESRHVNESTGFLVTVMAYTYMIFRTSDDRWHVFDSHGCLRYAVDEVIGSQQATVATFTTAGGVMAPLIEKHGHGAQSCCTRICVEEVQTPDSIPSPKTPTPCSTRPASPSSWSSWEMLEAGDVSVQDVVVHVPDDVDDDDDHASVLMRMASGIAIRTEPLVSCSMEKAREHHDESAPDVSPVVNA